MGAAQPVDDFLGPVEILAFAFQRPAFRCAGAEVAHVADLVGEFDQPRRFAGMPGAGHLQALAHFLFAPLMFVFLLVDLPLSAAADTIVLPFELFHEPTTPHLTLTDECNYSSMKLIKD